MFMKVLEDEPVSAADGYTHTSWHTVFHPAPPCSWHAISILNLNYPACFQHATLHPKPELATHWFLGCRLQNMSRPSIGVFIHKSTPPKNPPPPYKLHHCFLCYSNKPWWNTNIQGILTMVTTIVPD